MNEPTRICVTDAPGMLDDLIHRTEAGEDIILTMDGRLAVRLVPVKPVGDMRARRAAALRRARGALPKNDDIADGAHSQDFLYGDDGLPTAE